MEIRKATYKFDFCEQETDGEQTWVFRRVNCSGSIHESRRRFGLCHECSSHLLGYEPLAKKLMRWFGISKAPKETKKDG